jgi:hypothetical protein
MGSGFSAINIGDEIIEINNQVVVCSLFSRVNTGNMIELFYCKGEGLETIASRTMSVR